MTNQSSDGQLIFINNINIPDIFDLPFNKSDLDVFDNGSAVEKLNNSINNSNSQVRNIFPIVPQQFLFWYLLCAHGFGVILNVAVILEIFRRKFTNGFFILILQLSISDILLLTIVAVPEMWSHNVGSWIFGSEMCIAYLGFEVFSGTANVYFLIALCFHTITTVNILIKSANKSTEIEEQLLDDMTEIKSSRHSLVSRNHDSLQPNKSADMGFRNKTKISVIIPVILVWILAASLSVPEFALSTTIVTINGPNICTFIDGQRFNNVRVLLSVFQLIIPTTLLVINMLIMVLHSYRFVTNSDKGLKEMLKLAIWLQIVYFVSSTPRLILSTIHVFSYGGKLTEGMGDGEILDIFKTPPLNNLFVREFVLLLLSFLYFSSSILRPLFYACFMQYKKPGILSNTNEENNL